MNRRSFLTVLATLPGLRWLGREDRAVSYTEIGGLPSGLCGGCGEPVACFLPAEDYEGQYGVRREGVPWHRACLPSQTPTLDLKQREEE